MAPSLTTSKGPLKLSAGFSTRVMRTLPGGPIAALELRYETASTLLLRGVLQQSNPAHRAILQMFPGGWAGRPVGWLAAWFGKGKGSNAFQVGCYSGYTLHIPLRQLTVWQTPGAALPCLPACRDCRD